MTEKEEKEKHRGEGKKDDTMVMAVLILTTTLHHAFLVVNDDNKRRIIGIFNIKSDEKRREMRRLHEKCLFDVRNHFHSSLFL